MRNNSYCRFGKSGVCEICSSTLDSTFDLTMSIPREAHAYSQLSRDRTIHSQGDVSPVTPLETVADTNLGSVELMSPRLPQAPQANADNQQLDGSSISVPLAGSNIDIENANTADLARVRIATGDSIGVQVPPNTPSANDTILHNRTGAENPLLAKPLSVKTRCMAISNLTSWWYLEIVSAISSLICVVGVCAVLLRLDQTPLNEWMNKMHIQPNTLASILMTIAKAALLLPVAECISQLKWIYFQEQARRLDHVDLFDRASRGPFGALQLLWGLKYREKGTLGLSFMQIASILGRKAHDLFNGVC